MTQINNYEQVFQTIVEKTARYLTTNNLKSMVLGISGGIDSTVVAAICHEVSKKTGIPLIGRSLPTKYNKEGEITTADLVGKAFCDDYKVVPIHGMYEKLATDIAVAESGMLDDSKYYQSPLANGNIQARLRMIYLYNLAGIHKGLVMDTDNLTENNLGYFTIHGDVGDFNPIGGLWKTEVFALASYIRDRYHFEAQIHSNPKLIEEASNKALAIEESLKLKPTAGLGITSNDLEELGAESYDQVDTILQEIKAWEWLVSKRFDTFDSLQDMCERFLDEQQMLDIPMKIIVNVARRHFNSEFKRNHLPIKITRNEI
jgi:NAD+ synthetase